MLLLQYPDPQGLAERAREDRDPEVHCFLVHPHLEPAVLRDTRLGDVQLGHDFQARHQRGVKLDVERLHGVVEYPVNPVFHLHRSFRRLDVNVARSLLHGAQDNGVHQFDHRALVLRDLLDREHLIPALVFPDEHRPEFLLDACQDLAVALGLLEQVQDRGAGSHHQAQLAPQQQFKLVEGPQVLGIGHGDAQHPFVLLQRQEHVPVHQFQRDRLEQLLVQPEFGQRVVPQAILLGQDFSQGVLRDHPLLDQPGSQGAVGPLGLAERFGLIA